MSKKQKQKEQPVQKFSKEQIQAALEIAHSEYFMQVVALLSHDPDHTDLAFVKVPVTTPDGGTYLVSILHVDGPKVSLSKLKAMAEQIESENKKPADVSISGSQENPKQDSSD